ncbi:hypothetical protein [Paenibacillus gansuensis]|uniref:YkgJ family cysteine cluster protein n=1 Tax=Paenibacillus gansuensis TaxID=306542 RepID=A0ABW5PL85_9BACL
MHEKADQAARYCGYINPDRTCAIMKQLTKEKDDRCKYYRDDPVRCRYFELHVINDRRRR